MVEHTMDVSVWLRKQLQEAHPDLLRAMVKEMAEALMSADADAVCGAGYGERSPERVNRRNGYRERDWDTRVGSIELAVTGMFVAIGHTPNTAFLKGKLELNDKGYIVPGLDDARDGWLAMRREAGAAAQGGTNVEEPGLEAGEVARSDRGGLPHPPIGRSPLPVRDAGRTGGEVP